MPELRKCLYKNTLWICEYGEKWPTGVSKLIDAEELPAAHGERSCAQHIPHMAVVSSQRRSYTKMGGGEGCEIHWLYLGEDSSMVENANAEAGDQTSKGISDYADLCDVVAALGQLLKSVADLARYTFATQLNAVICETASIALGNDNVKLFLGKSLMEGSA